MAIVLAVVRSDAAQTPFAQDDRVIEALSADRAHDPFAMGILPRRAWGDGDLFDSHVLSTPDLKLRSRSYAAIAHLKGNPTPAAGISSEPTG